jgi:predicted DNA-binding transcriptional regulator AlpA
MEQMMKKDAAINQPHASGLLTIDQVIGETSIPRSSIYELVLTGKFPRPRKIGTRSRWVRSEIDAWVLGLEVAA